MTPDPAELPEDERPLRRFDGELVHLATLLHTKRHSLGMRMSDVANNSGLSKAGLSRIERGERTPTVRSVLALSEMYSMRIVIENGKVIDNPTA